MKHSRIHRLVPAALIVGALVANPAPADACSCMQSTVASSWYHATDTVVARVVWGVTVGSTQWYIARVRMPIKGCTEAGQWVYLKTATSGAACGVQLTTGLTYLLNAHEQASPWSAAVLQLSLCDVNKPVGQLSAAERAFLLGRQNCCNGACTCVDGTQPVQCFANPCSVTSCPTGECSANYCGGCNAEFWDASGYPVCTSCETSADCGPGQSCSSDGLCLPGCWQDSDCGEDYWCKLTANGQGQCTAYQQEGDSCKTSGFAWASKCAPGLDCVVTVAGSSVTLGVCMAPCEDTDECPDNQYCAGDGHCRDDGTCVKYADCSADGNSYAVPLCIGWGECEDGQCTWNCGTPPGDLTWYATCGNPVCGSNDPPPAGVEKCPKGVEAGKACEAAGDTCDAGLGCGAVLICADKDPKQQPGGCPISLREFKEDIRYLSDGELDRLHREVVDMRLARWRYIQGPPNARPQLGFIIDDNPQSDSVASSGERVDLYGFASMAVAALQVQQRQIEALTDQVQRLNTRLGGDAPAMCLPPDSAP